MSNPYLYSPLFWILISAVWGSFLGGCLHRLPFRYGLGNLKLNQIRSLCLSCHRPLAWFDMIPVLSAIIYACRCRRCGAPFDKRYFITELVSILLALSVFYGPLNHLLFIQQLSVIFLGSTLLALALIDLEHFILPDELVFLMALGGLVLSATLYPLEWIFWLEPAVGFLLGTGVLGFVWWFYKTLRGHEGLGQGDIKLMGAAGLWLGSYVLWAVVWGTILTLITICLIALYKQQKPNRHTPIPFGPGLTLGIFMVYIWRITQAI